MPATSVLELETTLVALARDDAARRPGEQAIFKASRTGSDLETVACREGPATARSRRGQ